MAEKWTLKVPAVPEESKGEQESLADRGKWEHPAGLESPVFLVIQVPQDLSPTLSPLSTSCNNRLGEKRDLRRIPSHTCRPR